MSRRRSWISADLCDSSWRSTLLLAQKPPNAAEPTLASRPTTATTTTTAWVLLRPDSSGMATVWAPLGPECGDRNEVCSRHFGVDEMPVAAWGRRRHLRTPRPETETS